MPSGSLAPVPRWRVLDANGNPLAGAKLETWAANTSTPLATYRDVELTIPHSNPILADAGGLFPAIYLSATSYKFILKTAAGAIVWSENVIPATHLNTSGIAGDVKFFGGDSTSPVTVVAYPAGATYDKCHAGTAIFNLDAANLPAGTYAIEAMLMASGGGTITLALVNLSDAPDVAMTGSEISSASAVGARVRSGSITLPAAGAAKDLAIKTKVSSGAGFAWAISLVRTA